MTHKVLIDGMGFIFRAYHGVRSNLTRADGLPTNALFGFAQMLVKVVDDLRPDLCAVVLDSKPPNWRHAIYDQYKANRPPPDEALVRQLDFVEPLIAAFGLPMLRLPGFEADDILATLAAQAQAGDRITIVTSDKDLLQLVREDEHITIKLLDTLSDTWRGVAASHEKFGVPPAQVLDVQALMGDSSDNIPGAPGVGPKTAAELVLQFGSVDGVFAGLAAVKREKLRDILKTNEAQVRMSRQLASLKADVPLPELDLTFHPNLGQAAGYLRDVLEFKSLAARLEKRTTPPATLAAPTVRADHVLLVAPPGAVPVAQTPTPVRPSTWGGYECVTTPERWAWWVQAVEAAGLAAWDTETTRLHPHSAELVGVSLAVAPGHACYVPLAHVAPESGANTDLFGGGLLPGQLPVKLVVQQLAKWLRGDKVKLIAHNFKYDVQILARALGVLGNPAELTALCGNFEDTMLVSGCLHGGRWGHGLDSLVQRHLGHTMIAFDSVCGKGKNHITFDRVALDAATAYAAEDADATLRLWQELAPQLRDGKPGYGPRTIYEAVEKPVLPVVAAMEASGIYVAVDVLRELSNAWAIQLAELEHTAQTAAGHALNVASPAQLGAVLFDELKLGTPKQQAAKGTGVDVLEDLLAQVQADTPGHALLTAVMQHRTLAKLRSTYAEALLHEVHPATGRVHTRFMQMGASTGRFSSSDPNVQNIPIRTEQGRKIRAAFVPRTGWTMLSADYSQIELRLLAHFSGSPQLTQAFADGLDIHAYTASLVAEIPLADVSKEQRRAAKFVNFGLVYGMGARSLAGQIGCSVAEAQEWLQAYFERYSGVREYMDANKAFAKEHGYVETLLGRRVWLPEINSPHGGLRSNAERAAINAPLQGSNADVIKLAMPQVHRLAHAHGAALLLQVHDELVLECPPEQVDALKAALPSVMADVVRLNVPLVAEVGVGPNWELAH